MQVLFSMKKLGILFGLLGVMALCLYLMLRDENSGEVVEEDHAGLLLRDGTIVNHLGRPLNFPSSPFDVGYMKQ